MKPGSSGCTDQLDHGVWLLGYTIRAFDSETAFFNVNLHSAAEAGSSAISATLANGTTTMIPVVNNASEPFPSTTFSDIRGLSVDTAAGQVALDPRTGRTNAVAGEMPNCGRGRRLADRPQRSAY